MLLLTACRATPTASFKRVTCPFSSMLHSPRFTTGAHESISSVLSKKAASTRIARAACHEWASGQQSAALTPPGPCRAALAPPFPLLQLLHIRKQIIHKPTGTEERSTLRDRPQQDENKQLCIRSDCVPCSYRLANLRQRASRRPIRYAGASSPPAFTSCTPCSCICSMFASRSSQPGTAMRLAVVH